MQAYILFFGIQAQSSSRSYRWRILYTYKVGEGVVRGQLSSIIVRLSSRDERRCSALMPIYRKTRKHLVSALAFNTCPASHADHTPYRYTYSIGWLSSSRNPCIGRNDTSNVNIRVNSARTYESSSAWQMDFSVLSQLVYAMYCMSVAAFANFALSPVVYIYIYGYSAGEQIFRRSSGEKPNCYQM